jgi:hypothetical protein
MGNQNQGGSSKGGQHQQDQGKRAGQQGDPGHTKGGTKQPQQR